jgi:hypothetical protein
MSDSVTAVTKKPVVFSGTVGQLRTLKDGSTTVALSTAPTDLKKILELVTACQAGNSLQLSAKIVQPKPVQKDAKEENHKRRNKQRRRWNNRYRAQ